MFAITSAVASSNQTTDNSPGHQQPSPSWGTNHHGRQPSVPASTQDNVLPFETDRIEQLESQVHRLGASLIEVHRKLDKLTDRLLVAPLTGPPSIPKRCVSESGDSDDAAFGPSLPSGSVNILGGFPNSGGSRDFAAAKGHHAQSSASLGGMGFAKRTFAQLKKKKGKAVVGFGADAKSEVNALPTGREDTGLDAAASDGELPVQGSQNFWGKAKRRMSLGNVGLQGGLDSATAAGPAGEAPSSAQDVNNSVDTPGNNPLVAFSGSGGDSPEHPSTKDKLEQPVGDARANPLAFSVPLGTSQFHDETKKPFWDFEPYHSAGNLNTIVDCFFIVAATALCVIQIVCLHPKADHYFIDRDFAPWWLLLVSSFLEILTGCWMVLKSVTREGELGWMSDTTQATRTNYIKTYLAIDLVYTIPLEVFLVSVPVACYWSMSRHWLRWIRIWTLRTSDNPFALNRPTIAFVGFLGAIVMIHHIMASVAWGIFSINAESGLPLDYLDALYWAVSTTTSTGYGDISPKEHNSRVVGMFSMISGGLIVAVTTAFATSILTSRDALEEEHEKKRKMMQSMLEHYQIPWSLRQHVITLFPHVLQTHSESQFKGMMESLPPGLSNQLSQYVQAKMLINVSVFKGLDSMTKLLPLVERLGQRFVSPQEVIVNQGDDSLEMYFLIFGTVQVIRTEDGEDLILSTLFSGTVFGEMGVIRGTKRAASIHAVTACELMVLTKEDFDEAIQEEGLEELISKNLDNYTMPSQRTVSNKEVLSTENSPRVNHINIPGASSLPEAMFQQQFGGMDPLGDSAHSTSANSVNVEVQPSPKRNGSRQSDNSTSSENNLPLGAAGGAGDGSSLDGVSFHAAPHRSNTQLPNIDSD